jgi:hypothetical protein
MFPITEEQMVDLRQLLNNFSDRLEQDRHSASKDITVPKDELRDLVTEVLVLLSIRRH